MSSPVGKAITLLKILMIAGLTLCTTSCTKDLGISKDRDTTLKDACMTEPEEEQQHLNAPFMVGIQPNCSSEEHDGLTRKKELVGDHCEPMNHVVRRVLSDL
ncbi:unnamed protein product [Leuciscus chuanchicus]